jgi:hypothetical protein
MQDTRINRAKVLAVKRKQAQDREIAHLLDTLTFH